MDTASPLAEAAMSKIATNNKVLLQLAEHRKLMKRVVALLEEQGTTDGALTVDQFCSSQKICRAFFYQLVKANRGPRTMRLANGAIRISRAAVRDWQRRIETETAA
jgi:predicted DNA-binding transcriptional regulator AlpA